MAIAVSWPRFIKKEDPRAVSNRGAAAGPSIALAGPVAVENERDKKPLVEISGDIERDSVLDRSKDYLLKFNVFVRRGVTLLTTAPRRPGVVEDRLPKRHRAASLDVDPATMDGTRRRTQDSGFALHVNGKVVALRERALVGRDPECDVALEADGLVSRRHARFFVCAHGVVIEDLDSRNGVYVDGERLQKSKLLVGGESIRIGEADLDLCPVSSDRTEPVLGWDDQTVAPRFDRTSTPSVHAGGALVPQRLPARRTE
jgi:hypothetical protein